MEKCIVVTGMGIISSIGRNITEFGNSLKTGMSGITYLKPQDTAPDVKIGAVINDFVFDTLLNRYTLFAGFPEDVYHKAKLGGRLPFGLQCSLLAALEAWLQADLFNKPVFSERTGIIIGGNNLNQKLQYNLYDKFRQTPEYITPGYALHYMDTDQVGTISEILRIQGEGFTVGGASASGNVAVLKGYQLIKHGLVDVCAVVGALADLSPMELQSFYNIGAMGGKRFGNNPQKACRPFDEEHEGFIYGQASACLVLESIESAQRREVPFLAEMIGGSLVIDGNHLPDPSETGETRVMKTVLSHGRIGNDEVDYINTHGTASPAGDETEVKAIRNVFKEQISRIWVNSTKSLTGHCLCSAGVAEAIATIIQMNDGFIHPNLNLERPIDHELRFSGATSTNAAVEIAMSNSFGFGGINTSIIFKRSN